MLLRVGQSLQPLREFAVVPLFGTAKEQSKRLSFQVALQPVALTVANMLGVTYLLYRTMTAESPDVIEGDTVKVARDGGCCILRLPTSSV